MNNSGYNFHEMSFVRRISIAPPASRNVSGGAPITNTARISLAHLKTLNRHTKISPYKGSPWIFGNSLMVSNLQSRVCNSSNTTSVQAVWQLEFRTSLSLRRTSINETQWCLSTSLKSESSNLADDLGEHSVGWSCCNCPLAKFDRMRDSRPRFAVPLTTVDTENQSHLVLMFERYPIIDGFDNECVRICMLPTLNAEGKVSWEIGSYLNVIISIGNAELYVVMSLQESIRSLLAYQDAAARKMVSQ